MSVGNNLQAMGAIKISKNLQHIYTPKTLFICNDINVAANTSGNACLQELYICGNNLQATDGEAIAKALHGICTLTKIHFASNSVSDEATYDIATVIYHNTKLKEIKISGSELPIAGTIKIMKALQRIYTLKKLYLNNNNITTKVAHDIAAVIFL